MVKVAWFIHLFTINYYCFWFENFYSDQNLKKMVNKQSTMLSTQKAKKKPAAQQSKIGQQTTS